MRPNLKPKTYEKYEAFVRLYIVPGLGSKRLGKLAVRDVRAWLNEGAPDVSVLRRGPVRVRRADRPGRAPQRAGHRRH